MPTSSNIERDILAFIQGQSSCKASCENDFNSLAINTFSHQHAQNLAYRRYCDALGMPPEKASSWKEIPAVTTDAFKLADHPLVTFGIENAQKTFLTSGTTAEIKGKHHFPSLALYEASIKGAWAKLGLPHPTKKLFLTPTAKDAPHSSLSHMMQVIDEAYAEQSSSQSGWAINPSGTMDVDAIIKAAQGEEPVALLGTALAFLHLFDQLDSPLSFPKGSWAMETGGYKGTGKRIEKSELYSLFEQKLGIHQDSVINEYSMTELSSQFYTHGLNRPHQGPSWTRVRVINPLTNKDADANEPGHLVIYDLANAHSVMAIRTQDIATRSEADLAAGNNSFTLLGRDSSALPRGCSRAADQQLSSS